MYPKRNGFTLIELLIYISLLASIAVATSSWVVTMWTSFMRQSRQSSLLMAVYCAHDVMMRDMRNAPRDAAAWKKRDGKELIWKAVQGDARDIGFKFDGTTLLRIEGNFDAQNDTWHGATKSILVKPIDRVRFGVNGNKNTVQSIVFTIESQRVSISQFVSLTQREIV